MDTQMNSFHQQLPHTERTKVMAGYLTISEQREARVPFTRVSDVTGLFGIHGSEHGVVLPTVAISSMYSVQ